MAEAEKFRFKYQIISEGFLYVVIGVIAAFTDAVLYVLFTRQGHLDNFLANFLSVNIGIGISFYLNSHYNFKKTDRLGKRALVFFTVGYFGLFLSMVTLFIGINLLSLNDLAVKAGSIFVVALCQFLLNKFVTFKEK